LLLVGARHAIAPELRLFPVRRYPFLSRVQPGGIEVVRVVHGLRDLQTLTANP